mmetsp:Transcript_2126/g.4902  ORF Transcript_2126/g.4902 Transcript_2126/m.4902 type:complete len:367 (+) Transcript_2126:1497-2597(+)
MVRVLLAHRLLCGLRRRARLRRNRRIHRCHWTGRLPPLLRGRLHELQGLVQGLGRRQGITDQRHVRMHGGNLQVFRFRDTQQVGEVARWNWVPLLGHEVVFVLEILQPSHHSSQLQNQLLRLGLAVFLAIHQGLQGIQGVVGNGLLQLQSEFFRQNRKDVLPRDRCHVPSLQGMRRQLPGLVERQALTAQQLHQLHQRLPQERVVVLVIQDCTVHFEDTIFHLVEGHVATKDRVQTLLQIQGLLPEGHDLWQWRLQICLNFHLSHSSHRTLPPVLRLALGFVGAQLQALHLDLPNVVHTDVLQLLLPALLLLFHLLTAPQALLPLAKALEEESFDQELLAGTHLSLLQGDQVFGSQGFAKIIDALQ